ncbi:Choline transporter protein 1 [Ranunculus cassubicifolius]
MRGGPLGAIIGRYPSSSSSDGTTTSSHHQLRGGASNSIISHNRKCRDVIFLIIFIAFWVSMIVNSSFAFNQGNPLRLVYGLDYKGNVCGNKHSNPNLRSLQLRYWVNPNQVYQTGLKKTQFNLNDARSICLKGCPNPSDNTLDWVCDYPQGEIHMSMGEWVDNKYNYFDSLTPEMRNTSLQLQGPCYPVIFPSVNVYWSCQFIARASNASLGRWQQLGGVNINEDIMIDKSIHRFINSRSSVLKRYVADVGKAWPVLIVCGGILPLFLSIFWLLMIRHFVAAMTWITVILFNVLIISFTMLYYLKAGWIGNDAVSSIIGDHDPYIHIYGREQSHLRAAAVLMTVVMIVSVLSSIAIIRRILMGTSVLKVAAKVIGEVQALIIFPVIPYTILAIFYMFWFSAALHLFSSGQIVQNDCKSISCCAYDLASSRISCDRCCGYSIHYTPHIAIAILFHLFGCYWSTHFFVACSSTVIAGSVASYYWARGETSMQQDIPFLPVFSSMKRLMRYNLGSVALGSLIVSFVEWIRYILESLRRKLKGGSDMISESWTGKVASGSSQFCVGCVDWTIRSVNRNAYIMIAITGKGFCKASSIATGLIMNNILRIGRVNVIGDVILFLGKLCVSLFCAVFAFLMLDTHKYKSAHNKISSPLFPVLVCWWLGYVVATLFFAVVEMSIDTIILSFCQDSEEHQGTAQYAPPLLMETLTDQTDLQQGRITQASP